MGVTRKQAKPQQPALTTEQVCEKIRDSILHGEIKSGDKLGEEDLAQRFQLSRTPIREAIRQLEVEGLVARTRYVGVTVRQLTPAELIELLDIREVLEGLVARLATRQMDAKSLARLRTTFKQMSSAVKSGNVERYLEEALAFRRILVSCCHSKTLGQYVMSIENRLRLMGQRTAQIPGRMAAAIDDHGRLLDAIERGDPHSAEQLNRKRIEAIRADVERSLSFY